MKLSTQLVCVLIIGASLTVAGPAAAQTQWFSAELSGANEVDNPGDSDGWGLGVIGLDGDTVHYYVWVTDVAMPTASHIHFGSAGQGGGIAVDFEASFSDAGSGSWVAFGSVSASAGTVTSILDDPSAFYFNVHNSDYPSGAVRGQVLGGGAASRALAGTLNGERQVDNEGDPDGEGFASVIFDNGVAHFYFNAMNTAEPSAAHIHRGNATENGSIVVDPSASFSGSVAVASVAVDNDLEREILESPYNFYFNVHNSEYAAGAVRGQLRATETVRIFPVISRASGQVGSEWRTGLNVTNLTDTRITAWARWFPANDDGLEGAEAEVAMDVAAGSTEVVDDAVATLFGANGNGALIVASPEPITASAHVFNDQRGNPEIGGTFGLFVPSVGPSEIPETGILLLGSNRPSSSGTDFRSNLVVFNPNPFAVDLTLTAGLADGSVLGSDSMSLEPFSNAVKGIFRLISSVPSDQRTQDFFTVRYVANAPVAIALTPVDNATNDGFYVVPSFAPPVMMSGAGGSNSPPNGTIVTPTGNQTISVGGTVNFEGMAEDPDGDAMTYLWDFGDDITTTALVPGNHTYSDSGSYTVTFTVTDSNGASDPTPDTRTITVEDGGGDYTFTAVQRQIFTPNCAFSGCHGGGSPAEGMSLAAGNAYANIVNVRSNQSSLDRIEPSDPDNSYLYLKVTGDPSIDGLRMPRGGSALSTELINLLRNWIERGAPND